SDLTSTRAYRTNVDGVEMTVFSAPFYATHTSTTPLGILRIVGTHDDTADTLSRLLWIDLAVVIGGVLVVVIAAPWLAGVSLRPLRRMIGTASAIGAGHWSARTDLPVGRDEAGQLGSALRAMVEELETLVRREHQFVADASHELRTPL